MNCYQYSVMNNEKLIKTGYLHASNVIVLEKRLSNEILSKTGDYTSFEFSQAFCQKCNGDHDVANFFFGQREVVLCQNCRNSLLKKLKKGAV